MKKMKNILGIMFMFVVVLGTINAATATDVLDYCKQSRVIGGKTVTLSADNIKKVENILNQNPITEAQGDLVIAKAKEAVAIIEKSGASSLEAISAADKQKIVTLLNEAGAAVGIRVEYDSTSGALKVYDKTGKLLDQISLNGKLPFTGNDMLPYVALTSILVAAIAILVAKKEVILNVKK